MKIISQKENALYSRKEITAEFDAKSGTPGRKAILKELAGSTGSAEDCIAIDGIDQHFGAATVLVHAKAYPSADALRKFEPAYRKTRDAGLKAGKTEEKAK